MKLHLGVLDIAYGYNNSSNGDVAEILEKNYGIMEFFVSEKADLINKAIEKDLIDFIDDALSGKPIRSEPFNGSCQKIERLFRQALTEQFMDGSNFKGKPVPTRAALDGVSHRFKNPRFIVRTSKKSGKVTKIKRKARPSFIDTGTYRQSFKAWVEL